MPLSVPTITTAEILRTLEILGIAWKGRIRFHDGNHSVNFPDETHYPRSPVRNFVCLLSRPGIRICSMFVPQHAKEAMILTDGPSTLTVGTHIADGENTCWMGCYQTISHGRTDIMFGPVIATEAHLAFAGARIHSNNTAEMSATIEGPLFSWAPWPVARGCEFVYFFIPSTLLVVLLGHDSGSHACTAGTHKPTVIAETTSKMSWTNTLRTSANEDLGTLAEYDPLAGYEPNDYHISEATEPYI